MIEAQSLSKRYGDKLAVNQLSFQVKPGMVTGFLGPNGAGKSTTMRMILGLDTPSGGRVTVAGKRYQSLPAPLHEVGALLDAKAIHGGRTAYNHLLCLAQSNGIGRKRVDEVLALVGLSEVAKKRSKGFSLGMGQRLGIAAALLGDPAVLMFDEPVNGLDPEGILWIRNLMKGLAAEGRTIFVSSHLMSEMQETAEHLVVIGRGKLIADVSMSEFIARSSGNSVLVRSPQIAEFGALLANSGATVAPNGDDAITVTGPDCARIGDLAAENNVRLHELSPIRASLEQAFMELTGDSVEYHAGAVAGADPTGSIPTQPQSGTEVSAR
jgi:ABC-2 type transport system ATP-binding protein